jgi:hypothetical protein
MEIRNTKTFTSQAKFDPFESFDRSDEPTRQRLNTLLTLNAETASKKSLYASEREKIEAELMKNPLSTEQTFAYFGLLLGTFPPAAIAARFILERKAFVVNEDFWFLGVFAIVNLISAVVGYFSGKLTGKIVRESEKASWTKMIVLLPFIGILWGMLAGGAGGIIIFVIGAVFGAIIGAAVGSVALPAFAIFHRLMKKGDKIDRKHFLPIAFGITFVISAFILGL